MDNFVILFRVWETEKKIIVNIHSRNLCSVYFCEIPASAQDGDIHAHFRVR